MRFLTKLRSIFQRSKQPCNRSAALRRRPLLEALEDRTALSTVSSIAANLNGAPIAAGASVWFNSSVKVSGLGAKPATIRVTDQTIAFRANGVNHTLHIPDSILTFSKSTTTATTTFDAGSNTWVTNLPRKFSGHAFLGGYAFNVGKSLPKGIKAVTWTANFATDTAGVSLKWQWGAAVYRSFSTDHAALGVKPIDGANGTHFRAGTPDNFTAFLVKNSRGRGAAKFTGTPSAAATVTLDGDAPPPPPPANAGLSGYVYYDINGSETRDVGEGGDPAIANVTISLYDSTGALVKQTTTDSEGFYSFTGLAAGDYKISESQPEGYNQGNPNLGSLGGTIVDLDTITVALGANDQGTDYNFGEFLAFQSGG